MKKILYIMLSMILGFREAQAIENNCPNPNIADVFYADGTCSADYIPSKDAIGIIYWLGAQKKGGLIIALDEPTTMNWSNAISYCKTYNKDGVTVWKLPETGKLIPMGVEKPLGVYNDKYNILNAKLASISGAKQLAVSFYWSDSEYVNISDAWVLYPSSGDISSHNKSSTLFVRCVLAF